VISIRPMPSSKGDAKQVSASREDAIDRPLEYLFTSSEASIESFHLSRLNTVANLRKELNEIFEEWVEAEVQARLAQWLLARKNPRDASSASSLANDSEERPTFRAAETSSTNRTATRAAAPDSDVPPAIARFVAQDPSDADAEKVSARSTTRDSTARDSAARDSAARDSVTCNSAPRDSAARPAARQRNRPASVVAAKPRSRSPITRSAIACRSPNFPAFVHSSTAGKPTTISKPGKASSTLLSFRRPHRSRIAS
jgi:hypothetical protein